MTEQKQYKIDLPTDIARGLGAPSTYGMSLRDWFAAHVSLIDYGAGDGDGGYIDCIDGFSTDLIEELICKAKPNDGVELILWYAEAEAAIRYVKADAMLARRNKETARA